MKNRTLLSQVVNIVNEIEFDDADDRHTFGDIYEGILKDLQSAGNAGEFYKMCIRDSFTFALISTVRYSSINACFSPALSMEK